MQNAAPASATGHALQSGQTIEATCLQRVQIHRRTFALHLEEDAHRNMSLHAVELPLGLSRAILVRLVHHIQVDEQRLDLHRMDLGCVLGVGRNTTSHGHVKARHMFHLYSWPATLCRTTRASSSPCQCGIDFPAS